ncbi:MAG TPA: hypothetical protein PL157_23380 [Acidobacteriota bacterium]|nr:hypothetical protein [Acidobacteriota bacterium]
MRQTIPAIMRDGKIELLEPVSIEDGTPVLVTILEPNANEAQLWSLASESTLKRVWVNPEDEAYGELLKA